jgi:hypothetical protein
LGGGDSGGAAGLLGAPSALELLITANDDRHARWRGGETATPPTFTLMEGMEGARDILLLVVCKGERRGFPLLCSWKEGNGGKGMRGEGLDTRTQPRCG